MCVSMNLMVRGVSCFSCYNKADGLLRWYNRMNLLITGMWVPVALVMLHKHCFSILHEGNVDISVSGWDLQPVISWWMGSKVAELKALQPTGRVKIITHTLSHLISIQWIWISSSGKNKQKWWIEDRITIRGIKCKNSLNNSRCLFLKEATVSAWLNQSYSITHMSQVLLAMQGLHCGGCFIRKTFHDICSHPTVEVYRKS